MASLTLGVVYNKSMPKPSPRQIKALEAEIIANDQLPPKPSEKRLKLNTTFENAVKQLGNTPPVKK
jgi:hypothetical protein